MEDIQDPKRLRELEYATQYFGFSPDAYIDNLTSDAKDVVIEILQAAKGNILNSFGDKVTEAELERAFSSLEDRYTERTEKIFLKMGKYMSRNLLSIPENVILPEDKVHEDSSFADNVDENDFVSEKNKFEATCRKVVSAKYKKAILEESLKKLTAVKDRQKSVLRKARELKGQMEALENSDAELKALETKTKVLLPMMKQLDNNPEFECTERDLAENEIRKRFKTGDD